MKIINNAVISKCGECDKYDSCNSYKILSGFELNPNTIDKDCPLQDICLIPSDEMSKGLAREIFLDTGIKDIDKVIVVYKREEK